MSPSVVSSGLNNSGSNSSAEPNYSYRNEESTQHTTAFTLIESELIIDKKLLIITIIAAISCLFGIITCLITISNEIQNPDIDD